MLKNIKKSWKKLDKESRKDIAILSSFFILTGSFSGATIAYNNYKYNKEMEIPKTAAILDEDSALLVDFNKYDYKQVIEGTSFAIEWTFYTLDGSTVNIVDNDMTSISIYRGEDSHNNAFEYAKDVLGEENKITSFNSETKTLTLSN